MPERGSYKIASIFEAIFILITSKQVDLWYN